MTEVTSPLSIERLAKHHDVEGFDSSKTQLNDFLTKYALHNQASGGARTYVGNNIFDSVGAMAYPN